MSRGGLARSCARRDLAAAASIERTIALTGPTAAGVIEKLSMPMPISAIASSGRPAISPQIRTGTLASLACVDDAPQEAQDRRAEPVIALGEARVGAVGGEQELGKVIGADRQEIDPRQQHGRAFRPGSAPRASRRIRSALGQAPLGVPGPFDLLLEQGAGFLIFPWLGDHREHDAQYRAVAMPRSARGPGPSSGSSGRAIGAARASPSPDFRLVLLVGEIGQRLIAADVDGPEDHRLVAGGVEHALVQALLALAAGQGGGDRGTGIRSGTGRCRRRPSAPARRVFGQPGIDHQRDRARHPWSRPAARGSRHIRLGASGSSPCGASKRVISGRFGRTMTAAIVAVDQDRVAFVGDMADVVRPGRRPARPSPGRRSSYARSAILPRAPRPSAAAGHIRAVRPGRGCGR